MKLLITVVDENNATVFAYATATHFKANATKGSSREMIGAYDLHIIKTPSGWRIDSFIYHLKFITGNIDLS